MDQDLDMYHEPTDTPSRVRTMNLNEDLGQVRACVDVYVFLKSIPRTDNPCAVSISHGDVSLSLKINRRDISERPLAINRDRA